jgi:hypothetical protein
VILLFTGASDPNDTVFSATYQFSNFIRLNAATFNYSIERALERLGEMIKNLST